MMRLHPGVLCVAFCTGCSCRWRAWLCARDARRTLRSSCFATSSQSCADRTTDQRSPTRIGPCSAPSRRPCPDRSEPAGSLHQRPCCVGIDAESPTTTPTDPTARSTSDHQRRRYRQAPAGNSFELSERHAAAASSTNTEEPPDKPRHGFGQPPASRGCAGLRVPRGRRGESATPRRCASGGSATTAPAAAAAPRRWRSAPGVS